MHEPCLYTVHAIRHRASSSRHFIGVHHPIRTTRVFNSFFLFLSSTIHCASLASLFIPLPLPLFPFSSFSRRNNEMWKNGSSLLKSEHRPRSLLCLLFPFRSRGRRKMAFGEYTLTGMEISLPLSSFSFLP